MACVPLMYKKKKQAKNLHFWIRLWPIRWHLGIFGLRIHIWKLLLYNLLNFHRKDQVSHSANVSWSTKWQIYWRICRYNIIVNKTTRFLLWWHPPCTEGKSEKTKSTNKPSLMSSNQRPLGIYLQLNKWSLLITVAREKAQYHGNHKASWGREGYFIVWANI
jgi:hypothetical protein